VAQQQGPGVRGPEWAAPAAPLQQPHSDDALKRPDLLAERGLGVPEPSGGARKRALFGHRRQGCEMAQLGSDQPMRFDVRRKLRWETAAAGHPVVAQAAIG
jgi:hypothetical protein